MSTVVNLRKARWKPVLIVFDFDGVLTDNRVLVFEDGQEAVFCNRSDGLGFDMLRKAGVPVIILSTETNRVVATRAGKLKVPCLQGVQDKRLALEAYCREHRVPLKHVLYVGNDLNDEQAMRLVGWTASPADAHPRIRRLSRIRLRSRGGMGVAREIAERLVLKRAF